MDGYFNDTSANSLSSLGVVERLPWATKLGRVLNIVLANYGRNKTFYPLRKITLLVITVQKLEWNCRYRGVQLRQYVNTRDKPMNIV